MKKTIFITLTVMLVQFANATVYLDETFNFTSNSALSSCLGWTAAGTIGTGVEPTINETPLSYISSGRTYYLSAQGKSVSQTYASGSTNYYISKPFSSTSITSGAVYLSFLYTPNLIAQSQTGSTAIYLGGTTNGAQFWVGKGSVSTSNFRFGVTRSSTSNTLVSWATTEYTSDNSVYFIVLKYEFSTGTASIYVNPVLESVSEPTASAFDNSVSTAPTSLQNVVLKMNGNNKNSNRIGGVRVSSTWTEAVASTEYIPPVSNALSAPIVGAATNISATGFTANWQTVANATGYTVLVYNGTTFVDSLAVSGQSTVSANLTNLIPELTYTYTVKAKGDGTNYTNSAASANSQAFALLTATIPSNTLKVILKLDDLGVLNSVLQSSAALDYMVANNIKWGSGAIANRFDATAPATLATYINAQNQSGEKLMEIWHHGYDHSQNNPTGTYEFSGKPYADQKLSFENADQAILNLLGVQMHSFGTPYNQSDAVTNTVIAENLNYKVMMFSKIKSSTNGILYLDNRVNMESATGTPDFSYFKTNYLANKNTYTDYMILQGHPNYYTAGSNNLEQFKLILKFLQSEGVTFVKPYEYYQSTSISTGIKTVESKDAIDFNFSFTNNNGTKLILNMKHSENLNCAIYSLTGSIVNPVFSGKLNAGSYSIPVDTSKLASGLYLCSLSNGITTKTVKFIVKH